MRARYAWRATARSLSGTRDRLANRAELLAAIRGTRRADTVGLPTVLSRVNEYRARFGDYWEPAPLLEKLVAESRGFYA